MGLHPEQVSLALAFLLGSAVSFGMAVWVPRRYDTRGIRTFAYVFVVVGVLGVVSATHVLFAGSLQVTMAAAALELGLATNAAVLWLIFAATYANRSFHQRGLPRAAIAGYALLAFLLPATDPLHGFVYSGFTYVADPFPHYEVVKGAGHYAISLAAYVPLLTGVWVLVRLLRSTRFMMGAIGALLFGVFALGGANVIPYFVDLAISYNPVYMPLGGTVLSVSVAAAIHFNLFSVTPVARQNVITAIRDPIVTLDKNRRIVDVNPAFVEAFTGAETGAAVAHRPFEDVAPVLADAVPLDGDEGSVRIEAPGEGHQYRHFTVSVSPVRSGPHLLGYTLVFRDVTDVVESRRELERQNAQLDEFAVSAAHNLRNPLGTIAGFTDVLASHLRAVGAGDSRYDQALVDRCLSRLDVETDRMDEIIADFLRVMREGKTVREVEPVDFVATAHGALDVLETDGVAIVVDRPGLVYADPSRLSLLVRTVLRSAHDRAGGPVEVRATVTEDGFAFEDDAGALPREDCEMLLEHGRMSKYDVTGLGLTVARTLANVHRWDVHVEPAEAGLRLVVSGAEAVLDDGVESVPAEKELSSTSRD